MIGSPIDFSYAPLGGVISQPKKNKRTKSRGQDLNLYPTHHEGAALPIKLPLLINRNRVHENKTCVKMFALEAINQAG